MYGGFFAPFYIRNSESLHKMIMMSILIIILCKPDKDRMYD
ncbi:hypothetical protein SAMN02745729_101304 [Marinobacterium iners DSM 11526]|uniref:Uncharacterized protein n=1 Tax=Marinobacterium iners DSM 11526 TaxID=1122198 RepID=A0A1H3XXN7_9GAMM|nr:hypothetical protein SAMN02745729_101304 [Marinobacterium iners DSM 11526]